MKKITVQCRKFLNCGYEASISPIIEELLNNLSYVEHYKSDIIYDIKTINDTVASNEHKVLWLGYRRDGVDHTNFILDEILSYPNMDYLGNYYRKLFRIEIENNYDETSSVTMEECSLYRFLNEHIHELNKRNIVIKS